jgi:hypothetical protein
MIRGAIEIANRSIISGWLYGEGIALRGQLVLAFVGKRHVGTGKIELFRKDIKDAGLGDGYSGFYFPVTLLPGEQPETIVVRLDQSDLALLHKESAIIPAPAATGKPAAPVAATKK